MPERKILLASPNPSDLDYFPAISRSSLCPRRVCTLFGTRLSPFSTSSSALSSSSHGLNDEVKLVNIEALFSPCSDTQSVKRSHALLLVSGKAQTIFISTRLINLYAHTRDITYARHVFNQTPSKDTYTWNSLISAYVRSGKFINAVNCFNEMRFDSNVQPDWYTFPPLLKACSNLFDGKRIHSLILKLGFIWDVYIAASLIHVYSRFGHVTSAQHLFDKMPTRDPASWNAMISGFCLNNGAEEALNTLMEMRREGIRLDPVTVASVLPACVEVGSTSLAMLIHVYVIKHNLEFDLFVSNALISMYSKFGFLEHSQRVFNQMKNRDLVTWNSMIAAYEQNGDSISTLFCFREMVNSGFHPDALTLVSLSSVTAQSGNLKNSRFIHGFVTRRGWISGDILICNAVMDMYAKMGDLDSARKIFDLTSFRDVISWNTLITGYSQNGFATEAIEIYSEMELYTDIKPGQGTFVSVLPAYTHLGALKQGTKIHGRAIKTPLQYDIYVATCLIDMYGKCGRLDDALSLFYQITRRNSVPWNAIISCHGIHGYGEKALKLFGEMMDEGIKPDHITLLSLLSACSHSGLVDQGFRLFNMMREEYMISPNLKHYGCMVDLLGRGGELQKAYDFILDMPVKPDSSVWGALLAACRTHGDVELAKITSEKLFEIDSGNVGYYVLLSNIYAKSGKWERVKEVRSLAIGRGLSKTPGWSSVEIDNKIEVFYTGNKTHPRSEEIYKELEVLMAKMRVYGYVPDHGFVLQDVEEDEKEDILRSHSERLAIAFALISSPPKSSIRVFKNLRVCGDCHNATKLISLITEREIVVRDSNRFHHFKDGVCSCGDYW
ncbi:uncharacterized protein [Phyllobates terribilis]|uniref:uncharacterized protein n=1 Tax=Phyllobates terribilis TaxID=111132 RepID=UPI003CCB1E4D